MGPITAAIRNATNSYGNLVNEGFMVKCAGITDADGNVTDRHLIATLNDHLPGTQAHAWTNEEFTDDLWLIDPSQTSIDWSNPTCCVCGKGIAP